MHNFCGGCLSEQFCGDQNTYDKCPVCWQQITHSKLNPLLKEILEAHIEKHPEDRRSKEELEQLDKKNVITHLGLTAAKLRDIGWKLKFEHTLDKEEEKKGRDLIFDDDVLEFASYSGSSE